MQGSRPGDSGSLLRAIALMVGWSLIAPLVGMILFGPMFLALNGFERWVDVPACSELCVGKGLAFDSFYAAGKNGTRCTCAGLEGRQSFPVRFTVTGGSSVLEHVFDWFVRFGAILLSVGVWIGAGAWLWKRREGRATH